LNQEGSNTDTGLARPSLAGTAAARWRLAAAGR